MVAHHICPQGCLILANVVKTTNEHRHRTIGMTIKGDRKYPINCIVPYLEHTDWSELFAASSTYLVVSAITV